MENAFDPAEMAVLMRVVHDACARIVGCDETMKAHIASKVLAYADRGHRDYETLLALAIGDHQNALH